MSEYWSYRCETCGADSEGHNRADDLLRDLARVWPLIRAVEDAATDHLKWYLEIGLMAHGDAVSFLREHDGHDLWLVCEYASRPAEPLNILPREAAPQ